MFVASAMDVVSFVCCATVDADDVVAAVVAIAANLLDANDDIDGSPVAFRMPFSIASELLFVNANADVDPYKRSTKLRLCVGD